MEEAVLALPLRPLPRTLGKPHGKTHGSGARHRGHRRRAHSEGRRQAVRHIRPRDVERDSPPHMKRGFGYELSGGPQNLRNSALGHSFSSFSLSTFRPPSHRHSVKIRRFRECRPQLIDCEFPHWYTTPDCFAISPCSTSFIASRRKSIWYGQMEQDNSHTRDGTPIQCHHWDITPQLEELDKIADICYSPDGRDIAVVSFMGRILVFENGKGFDEPLLVHDKLLEKYFGECTYKKVTCANWSQSELLLTGTIFGVVAVPIEYAIRKARQQRSRPTKPLNVVFN